MIRRPESTAAGQRWLLIPQPQHAQLAGVLAEQWSDLAIDDPATRQQLLASVHRHDDGWRQWEQAPAVDTATGRPLDFTEMPTADALAIWTQSIEGVTPLGPLPPWIVSGHFCNLLRHSIQRGDQGEPDRRLASEFLHAQQARQADWLNAWQKLDPHRNTKAVAAVCLQILQSFDWLSLWLCCRERSEPLTLKPTETAAAIVIRPHSAGRFNIEPWPFRTPTLDIQVSARSLPVDRYQNGDVVAEKWTPTNLAWRLEAE
jgi:hypothetical protein